MKIKNRMENLSIVKQNQKDRVFCSEPYAQEMYNAMCGHHQDHGISTKDFKKGYVCKAEIFSVDASGKALAQTVNSYQTVSIDLGKESRFVERQLALGIEFDISVGAKVEVMIEDEQQGIYIASIQRAHEKVLKNDLMASLKDRNSAYTVTVKGINEGGFIVDLQGLECFMPGSLAAANKVTNFESLLGKQITVMIETYLETSDMFVVSNKRYIQHILPLRVKELSFVDTYKGSVTGSLSYGCFIEWDEIFTGLLHETEATIDIKDIKPGTEVEFYIKEVKENNRIILSQKGPSPEILQYQAFKENCEGNIFIGAKVKDIKPFGIFVDMDGVTGMLSPKEFKRTGGKIREGESVDVVIKTVDVGARKIYLRAVEEGE